MRLPSDDPLRCDCWKRQARSYTGSGVLTAGTRNDSPAMASTTGVEAAGLSNSPSHLAMTTVARQLPTTSVSYTHLRAHETGRNLVCRLLLEKKKKKKQ